MCGLEGPAGAGGRLAAPGKAVVLLEGVKGCPFADGVSSIDERWESKRACTPVAPGRDGVGLFMVELLSNPLPESTQLLLG